MIKDWYGLHRRIRPYRMGRWLLALLALPYGLMVWTRYGLYAIGILRQRKLPVRTVCFGNLTVGGTGKTSAVILAAEELADRKRRPAILTRGYRRPQNPFKVITLADGRDTDWRKAGDEAWMIRQALKHRQVPVLVCPDRYRSGMMAAKKFGATVALMDDGFQHLALKRDADVVLLDASDPFGGGLLPYGLSREPRRALRRASLALLTHVNRVSRSRLQEIRKEIEGIAPTLPVAEAIHRAHQVLDPRSGHRFPLKRLRGRQVVALSGIGDPEGFEKMLSELGAILKQAWRYPDHHPYTKREIRTLEALRGGCPLVTTFKDLPRLPPQWPSILTSEVWVLVVGLRIVRGQKDWKKVVLGRMAPR